MSATPTPSDEARGGELRPLAEVRAGILSRPGLVGVELRVALTDAYDDWLATLLPDRPGVALVAVGGLGRGEPAPFSDLDLVLLHDGRVDGLGELADSIWYPVWDSGVGLDHSVRTADEALDVAKGDLKALLGLLDIRHVAGDCSLWGPLRGRVLDLWRRTATKRFGELQELARERWALVGDAAFLLEPNLKDSRGGMRDAHLLHALAVAQLIDFPPAVRAAYPTLLDARGELQRRTGRADDVMRQEDQQAVGEALGMSDEGATPAADVLLRRVNEAARTVAHSVDTAWRRIESTTRTRRPQRRVFGGGDPSRVGVAPGVVVQDGEVVLARDTDPASDAELVLRAARAAAEQDLPLSDFALARLAAAAPPLPVPWPEHAREEFVSILGAGAPAVHVLEALDLAGLLEPLVPEWAAVRSKAQHNPVHRYTVDRHLLETAAEAAAHAREVPRPDLLLVGAFLHDIGKGYPGDHSVVGAERATAIATRMGFPPEDVVQISKVVRHHLLLPDTATRRDLDDPATIAIVTDAVGESGDLLDMLHALSIADAAATGPAVWSEWKAGLIRDLVRRAHNALHGEMLPAIPPLADELRGLAEAGELAVDIDGDRITVAAPDRIGVLYRTAGVLALHSLDVRSASIRTHEGMAVNTFVVEPRFGSLPDPSLLRAELAHALDGTTGLADRLRAKERAYSRSAVDPVPPLVLWFDDEATDATVVEIRASDSIGLLCRLTAALERCQLDVRSARVSSTAGSVVDAFYVTTRDGRPVPEDRRRDIEAELAGA